VRGEPPRAQVLKAGDRSAFAALVRRHGGGLLRFARLFVRVPTGEGGTRGSSLGERVSQRHLAHLRAEEIPLALGLQVRGTACGAEDKSWHTAVALRSGKVLVSGGRTGAGAGTPSATSWLYDPIAGTFASTASLQTARGHHSSVRLGDGRVLVCGGGGTSGDLASCELCDAAGAAVSPTLPMLQPRVDFGLVPITVAGIPSVLAVTGSLGTATFAELYNPL
jgi:hypothetical protein